MAKLYSPKRDILRELNVNIKENGIMIPNEIFKDLSGGIESSAHLGLAYSYIYITSYIYRYVKYTTCKKFTQKDFKEILQLSPVNKKVDYLIGKDGILENIGYIETTGDYPISWEGSKKDGTLKFNMSSNAKKTGEMFDNDRNYKIKFPTKSFFRGDKRDIFDGTFFEFENTHFIHINSFLKCMDSENLGTTAFYIYCFIRMKNDQFGDKFSATIQGLSNYTSIKLRTLKDYIKELSSEGLIELRESEDYSRGHYCFIANKNIM